MPCHAEEDVSVFKPVLFYGGFAITKFGGLLIISCASMDKDVNASVYSKIAAFN